MGKTEGSAMQAETIGESVGLYSGDKERYTMIYDHDFICNQLQKVLDEYKRKPCPVVASILSDLSTAATEMLTQNEEYNETVKAALEDFKDHVSGHGEVQATRLYS